jgi:hypothetical protein
MMRIVLLAGGILCCAAAQPPVIRVMRNGPVQAYAGAKAAVNVIGLSSVAGASEIWLLELHDSFASLEDLDRALIPAGPLVPGSSAFVGSLRLELSYRAQEANQNLPKMRYIDVAMYHIQPSARAEFEKFLKARRFALSSVNLDRPALVYQIVSGEPVSTFAVITPLPSLRTFDDVKPAPPAYAQGDQSTERKAAAASDFIGVHSWFRINPGLSYVSDEFASADADFWRVAR